MKQTVPDTVTNPPAFTLEMILVIIGTVLASTKIISIVMETTVEVWPQFLGLGK